jgi:hypothetical protein
MAAIECEVGVKSPTIPLEVTGRVTGEGGGKSYRYRVSNIRGLWPMVAAFAAMDSMDKLVPYESACRVRSKTTIKVQGIEQVYELKTSQALSRAGFPAFGLATLLDAVDSNPFEKASVEWVKVEAEIEPGRFEANIERIELPPSVRSGEKYTARVHIRPFGAAPDDTKTFDFTLTAPIVETAAVVMLSAAAAGRMYPPGPRPRTLKEMLDEAVRAPSMETLRLVETVTTDKGAGAEGVLLRHLPNTAATALGGRAAYFGEGREYDVESGYVLNGSAKAVLEVTP